MPTVAYAQADTAQNLYQQSVNIFTYPHMEFVVESHIQHGAAISENRTFKMIAKKTDEENSSLLLRFLQPVDLRCTAILINKKQGEVSRFVYFPSLKRVRVIPESDKQKEVLGMGISFEEMSKPKGEFEPLLNHQINGKPVHKLTLVNQDKKTVFYIDKSNKNLLQIIIFAGSELIKQVDILDSREFFGEKVITHWKIEDKEKQRIITYKVKESSITDKINDEVFNKNRLKRCQL